jgi:methylglutaconyl-CoA hydratase
MSGDEQAILQEISDGVARVTMNRPERHNAFDDGLIRELTETLQALAEREDLHAVVLAGSGRSFSAGADLHWMRRMAGYTRAENHADALALARLMETLDGLALPVIARVHGAAIGGGVGLVAAADIAIAAQGARFGLS